MALPLRTLSAPRCTLFSVLTSTALAGAALLTGSATAATYTLGTGTAPTGDAGGTSSFTNPLTGAAAGWYLNGAGTATAPTAGNAYIVATTAAANNLRGPNNGNAYTFPGDSLSVNPGGRFLMKATGTTQILTVNNLILNGGYADQATGGQGAVITTLNGNISVTAPSAMGALAIETLTVGANIGGSSALTISGTINGGGDTGTVIFTGTNTGFSGMLTLSGGTLDVQRDGGLGTGNVSLTAGTLRLDSGVTNNYIGDAATFSLLANTTANLAFTGTDTVGNLVLGGTTLGPGVYNAANQPTFFTGTGSITVVPEPTTVAQFILCGLAGIGWWVRSRRLHAIPSQPA